MNNNKIVYVAMSVDLVHVGHLNIINVAKSYGKVIVGLLTDRAIASYKRIPFTEYKDRFRVISSIKGVHKVIQQSTHDYVPNLIKLKPDFVIHGDDWKQGPQKKIRDDVIKVLKNWGGKLVEPNYTVGISSTKLNTLLNNLGTTPEIRKKHLRRLIESKELVRILDIHNGLSGLIIENTKVNLNNRSEEFDGMWASSLTSSTSKGKPDIEAVDLTERLQLLNEVLEVTTKPIIYDGDTGGKAEHFVYTVKTLERLGVSAVIIEDKTGLKKNSLLGNKVKQTLENQKNFCQKIKAGKLAKATNDFMIIARLESLILNKGMDDAVRRAKAYINAGADAIMIHSKKKDPSEIFKFCKIYKKFKNRKPLVVVPTTFSQVKEKQLIDAGVNIVIYANHLFRSTYPSMINTAISILKNKRSLEAEKNLIPIKQILELIPGTK